MNSTLPSLPRDAPAKKMHVLTVEAGGKVAMNLCDNAILVHHAQSKVSAFLLQKFLLWISCKNNPADRDAHVRMLMNKLDNRVLN